MNQYTQIVETLARSQRDVPPLAVEYAKILEGGTLVDTFENVEDHKEDLCELSLRFGLGLERDLESALLDQASKVPVLGARTRRSSTPRTLDNLRLLLKHLATIVKTKPIPIKVPRIRFHESARHFLNGIAAWELYLKQDVLPEEKAREFVRWAAVELRICRPRSREQVVCGKGVADLALQCACGCDQIHCIIELKAVTGDVVTDPPRASKDMMSLAISQASTYAWELRGDTTPTVLLIAMAVSTSFTHMAVTTMTGWMPMVNNPHGKFVCEEEPRFYAQTNRGRAGYIHRLIHHLNYWLLNNTCQQSPYTTIPESSNDPAVSIRQSRRDRATRRSDATSNRR